MLLFPPSADFFASRGWFEKSFLFKRKLTTVSKEENKKFFGMIFRSIDRYALVEAFSRSVLYPKRESSLSDSKDRSRPFRTDQFDTVGFKKKRMTFWEEGGSKSKKQIRNLFVEGGGFFEKVGVFHPRFEKVHLSVHRSMCINK